MEPLATNATYAPEAGRAARTHRLGSEEAPRRAPLAARRRAHAAHLPTWEDIALVEKSERKPRHLGQDFVERISTRRFVVVIFTIATAFTLYVGHVYATQKVLSDLQSVRRENLRLHLKSNRLKGEFEYKTGPAVIYERARALGLEEGFSYGPTIHLAPPSTPNDARYDAAIPNRNQ